MTKDWLSIQDEACQLHANRYTLDEIKAALYDRHKFQASTRAWRLKFKQWGIKHRTANTSRIRKTATSKRRMAQVSDKHAVANASAIISFDTPVLRYFKDGQVSEDTEYLEDLDEAEQWSSLAQEFVAHDYDDEVTASYYECMYWGESLYHEGGKLNLIMIRRAFDQIRKKAFWDIMRNRAKVLPILYRFLSSADFYCLENLDEDFLCGNCVERNEYCVHPVECLSLGSVILLHTKDQDVPWYWTDTSQHYGTHELILRAWVSGGLSSSEQFFQRYTDHTQHNEYLPLVESILIKVPDEYPEIKVKAMRIAAAKNDDYGLDLSVSISWLRVLDRTQTLLSWRLAEIILLFPGAKPSDYLKRLADAFDKLYKEKEPIDLTKPCVSIANGLRASLKGYERDDGHWEYLDDAEKQQAVSCFIHVITKAWVELTLQDDAGSLDLNVNDILKIREAFGGLPELKLSVDATALSQMAGSPYFESLRPRLLGWESEPDSCLSQDRTNGASNEAAEAQVI